MEAAAVGNQKNKTSLSLERLAPTGAGRFLFLETPISGLEGSVIRETPIGRLAFPGKKIKTV
jgi:hypothetical protein